MSWMLTWMNCYIEQHLNDTFKHLIFITDDQLLEYSLSTYTSHNLVNIQLEKKIFLFSEDTPQA